MLCKYSEVFVIIFYKLNEDLGFSCPVFIFNLSSLKDQKYFVTCLKIILANC